MRKNLTLALLIVAVVLTAILSIANIQSVTVNYLFGTFQLPLFLLILLSVGLGMFIQVLINFASNMSLRQEIKRLQDEKKSIEPVAKKEEE